MKKIIFVFAFLILAVIFLPLYNGKTICGFNPQKGCWVNKINLIEYIKYKQPFNQTQNTFTISELELQQGWYYGDLNQKKIGTPATWINTKGNTRSEQWYDPTRR